MLNGSFILLIILVLYFFFRKDRLQWLMGHDPVFKATEDAIALIKKGDYDAAVFALRARALRRKPKDRRARLYLGLAKAHQFSFNETEEILTSLISENIDDDDTASAQIVLDRIVIPGKTAQ